MRSRARTRPEDTRPDPNPRGPFGDGRGQVCGGTHGQGIEPQSLAAQDISQGCQLLELAPLRFEALYRLRQTHESAQAQARQGRYAQREFKQLGRVHATLAALAAGIHLQADIERRQVCGTLPGQAFSDPQSIQGMHPIEMGRHFRRLIALQRPDEMPDQRQVTKGLLFQQSLLDIVLAEIDLTQYRQRTHLFRRSELAHGQQAHARRIPTTGRSGGSDLGQHGPVLFCQLLVHLDFAQSSGFAYSTVLAYGTGPDVPTIPSRHPYSEERMDIGELLAFSVKNGASDLHLSAGLPPMIRVDGDVRRINVPAMQHKDVHDLVYDIMNDKQRKDYEEFLETDFSFEVPGLARFRVNAFNQARGSGAVFRTIPSVIKSLEELKAPKIFKDISDYPRGVVLVTGPTGSGKSTTLAAMVNHKNETEYGHILTVEDPIEFVHQSKKCLINQREVHRDTLGFNEALRSALREDPDVILVGEMRDLETIRLALTAAETGHLVFGTLHTSSAAKTIDRVVDVFPAAEKDMVRAMLSESLRAVISQSLLKRNGGGRVAAHEIMIGTPAIRNLIRENKIAQMYSAIQTGAQFGMQTLDQCLQELVQKNIVTRQEAKLKAQNKDLF